MRFCPECGQQVKVTTAFCGGCGSRLPPQMATGSSPYAQPGGETRAAPPGGTPATTARWGQPPLYGLRPTSPGRSRQWLVVGLVLLMVGVAVLATWWFTSRQPNDAVPSGPVASASAQSTSTGGVPLTTATIGPPSVVPTEPQTAPPTASVAATAPGGAPVPSGSYILVLDSLEQTRYSAQDALQRAAGIPGGVAVVDSSTTPGLRAGYWALVSSRYFGSEAEARRGCSQFGRDPSGACYPRRIG